MSMSIRQVYQLARGAGLGHEAAVMATAIAIGESGLNPGAVGDTSLTDATWGPSIGLWQVRSVKAESGTGKTRDATRLKSPEFNARSMAAISLGGSHWTPWTIYTNGAYRTHLTKVRAEVSSGAQAPGGKPSPVGWDLPGPLPEVPDPGDVLSDLGGAVGGAASGTAGAVVGLLVKSLAPAVLIGAGLVGGFALIVIGAWRGSVDRGES
ncbi:hypothetical protein JOE61_003861 [Nocardioides salarius]|uniref:Transglycosylase SLT domain-containing protein n=2 Tax=Nocardioides salarius TaxID=374513 RepID=A0ABS2MFZ8_9ACTN|nr:hypothetical protein [Nocardioides salarius]